MLLAVEVGNSNTLFGLYRTGEDGLLASWRLSTERERMPDEWFGLLASLFGAEKLRLGDVDGVIVSSVVPSVTGWLSAMSRERLGVEPVIVSAALDLGLRLLVEEPSQVGADRLADAVAAFARYGGPAIVIDLGTATTFDVISAEGDYLGGAIAAGVATSLKALSVNAAQLFAVELRLPERAIGKSTLEHLRSGIVLGHLAMLEGMVGRIRDELGVAATTILTGGVAPLFAGASPLLEHHDPELTLAGLRLIYGRLANGTVDVPMADVAAPVTSSERGAGSGGLWG